MFNFPINSTMFMSPRSTPESAWLGHIPFAGWLVEEMRPGIFVELGTHRGASYLAFCQAVQQCVVRTKCFAVDTWEGDKHAGEYGGDVYLRLLDYHQRNYAEFSRLMKMRFEEAVQYFEDGSVDLLHIDGMHTYDAVSEDFENWLPKLSDRAVVIFHDVNVREREFGVWRYWNQLSSRYPSFEFTHTHGLGVLLVGSEQPQRLKYLCGTTGTDQAVLINRLFDQMGRLITSNIDIGTLAQEQGRLNGVISDANSFTSLLAAENAAVKDSCVALELKLKVELEKYQAEVQRGSELFAGSERSAELLVQLRAELARNEEFLSVVEKIRSELSSLSSLLVQREGELEQVAMSAHQLELERARLASLVVQKESELEQVAMSAHHLELEMVRIKSSRSWRLTAPLRSLLRKK